MVESNVCEPKTGYCFPTLLTQSVFNRCVPSDLLPKAFAQSNNISSTVSADWAQNLSKDLLAGDTQATWQQVYANLDVIGMENGHANNWNKEQHMLCRLQL